MPGRLHLKIDVQGPHPPLYFGDKRQSVRKGWCVVIEKYFMEGVRFSWSKPATRASNNNGAIVASTGAANAMSYIGLSDKVSPQLMISPVSSFGLQMRMAINYDWCDYITGQTAQKQVAGHDILTGPMSGCIIARYTVAGVTYVGHVGTMGTPTVDTLVKRTFGMAMPPNTTGFNPSAAWGDRAPLSIKHGRVPTCFALVTTTGEFYTIIMMPEHTSTTEWVCGGAKKVPAVHYGPLRQQLGLLTMGVRG
jgi:hypothetical protein